jgi:hypothetical protein
MTGCAVRSHPTVKSIKLGHQQGFWSIALEKYAKRCLSDNNTFSAMRRLNVSKG